MIERIDEFIFKIVEACLDWLNEWLSITQKQVLSALLVGWGVAWVVYFAMQSEHWTAAILAICAMFDWFVGRNLGNIRKAIFRVKYRTLRFVVLCFNIGSVIGTIVRPHGWSDAIWLVGLICISLDWYVSAAFIDSERGGKRKLALAKLKELFGALEWIPAPEMGQ